MFITHLSGQIEWIVVENQKVREASEGLRNAIGMHEKFVKRSLSKRVPFFVVYTQKEWMRVRSACLHTVMESVL